MLLGKDVNLFDLERTTAEHAGFSTVSDVEECPVAYPASVKRVGIIWDVTAIAFVSWSP